MIVLPAIDLKEGQCVRLIQGKKDSANVYSSNAVEIAQYFENIGAEFIHIVDLDGAFEGEPKNFDLIKQIVNSVSIPVEVGGGIRDEKTIQKYLDNGVSRVIIGTKAIEDIKFLENILKKFGDKIAVSLDAKNDYIATKGWTEVSKEKVLDKAKELEGLGLKTLIYTDISRDGMLSEPNYEVLKDLNNNLDINIIASGGVANKDQLDYLKSLNLYGAITGKAIYEKKIDLEEYLQN